MHVDLLKVAHHGSDHNLSNELLDLIDCDRYLISTSGARHDHPNEIAIARILKHGGVEKELVFNYRDRAALWDVTGLKDRFGYTVRAPGTGRAGRVRHSRTLRTGARPQDRWPMCARACLRRAPVPPGISLMTTGDAASSGLNQTRSRASCRGRQSPDTGTM